MKETGDMAPAPLNQPNDTNHNGPYVDGGDDGASTPRDLLNGKHDGSGGTTVQPAGRLICSPAGEAYTLSAQSLRT
jgi:hypothetical protein